MTEGPGAPRPLARGTLLAVAAAALFGVTTPWVHRAGANVGPFATAALLYAGAFVATLVSGRGSGEARLRAQHLLRLALVAALGAFVAPVCLAWGLQRTGALAAALLSNLEAVLTVALAWLVHREPVGRRVVAAALVMLVGGALVALRGGGSDATLAGASAIALATAAWALDNTLARPLADLDPASVVRAKSFLGAATSAALALGRGDAWPQTRPAVELLLAGALGYGVSLALYLRAQRVLGAARTGSVFALAPFVGAVTAFAAGDRAGAGLVVGASACFALGVYLHATERHAHRHRHPAEEHDHLHRHDDGHHDHAHDPPFVGAHTHPHRHEARVHDHDHGDDLHHRHEHGAG